MEEVFLTKENALWAALSEASAKYTNQGECRVIVHQFNKMKYQVNCM